jgi:lincosamide nucleotidyltransferase A/C/D/E
VVIPKIIYFMKANEVIKIYKVFKTNEIKVWIDGGWGVDALLHEETREHSDLDIVIELKFVEKALSILKDIGFCEINRPDSCSWNFVMSCDSKFIDFHVIEFNEIGNGIYGPVENGIYYPNYSFGYTGYIENMDVDCISPRYQIESHTGYMLSEKDFHDVSLLCKNFGIPIPLEYAVFMDGK